MHLRCCFVSECEGTGIMGAGEYVKSVYIDKSVISHVVDLNKKKRKHHFDRAKKGT